jgi:hypothetical protein
MTVSVTKKENLKIEKPTIIEKINKLKFEKYRSE